MKSINEQRSLFDPPARSVRRRHRAHRPTEASSAAYEKIKNGRCKLYKPLLRFIANAPPVDHFFGCPTARELLRTLIRYDYLPSNAERNNISPRLNELLQAGCIENPCNEDGSVYLKTVPGDATASTWRITAKGRELLQFWQSEIKPEADI